MNIGKFLLFSLSLYFLSGIYLSGQELSGKIETGAINTTISGDIVNGILLFNSSISSVNYRLVSVGNQKYFKPDIPGFNPAGIEGSPMFLSFTKLFELEKTEADLDFEYEFIDSTVFDLSSLGKDVKMYPFQPSASKSDSLPSDLFINSDFYDADKWTGDPVLDYNYQGKLRGLSISSLIFNPLRYNPIENRLIIYHTIRASLKLPAPPVIPSKLKSPAFHRIQNRILKQDQMVFKKAAEVDHPMTMVVVSDTMFRESLQPLLEWKRKKGFRIIEAYTADPAVGKSRESIRDYLKGLYNDPPEGYDPATYLMIVGDVEQIPKSQADGHITDLYYAEYDGGGDYIPDLFYGRISVSADTQLLAVIDKILEYELYAFPDPSFLDYSVLIAGYDSQHGSIEGNGQINYVHNNYLNESNGYSPSVFLHPMASSQDSLIRALVSQGASFVNYTGHGDTNGWLNPSFRTGHISSLGNKSKYPLMIGNGCQTNVFTLPECFAEAIVRAKDRGAIGYIGCTYDSYWDDDFYWSVGVGALVSDPTYENTGLGYYDKVFHLNGEAREIWSPTLGEMIFAGNMSVQESNSSRKKMYWEIYQLMGDPSLIPWFKIPVRSDLDFPAVIPQGTKRLDITALPYDYIAISRSGTLIYAGNANEEGYYTAELPDTLSEGFLTIVSTGEKRVPVMDSIIIGVPEKGYLDLLQYNFSMESIEEDQIISNGESFSMDLTLINRGSLPVSSDTLRLDSRDTIIQLLNAMQHIDSILPGDTILIRNAFRIKTSSLAEPGASYTIIIRTFPDIVNREIFIQGKIAAPDLISNGMEIDDRRYGNGNGIADPGEIIEILWNVMNKGDYRTDPIDLIDRTTDLNKASEFIGFSKKETLNSSGGTVVRIKTRLLEELKDTLYIFGPYELTDGRKYLSDQLTINPGRHFDLFSTGNLKKFNYSNNSSVPWEIDSLIYFSSAFAARSGNISDYGRSELSLSFNLAEKDSISFRFRVSSEYNYDFFRFYIDSVESFIKSGITDWNFFSAQLEPGNHLLKWVYTKDQSISRGDDAAWVDDIIFPKSAFTDMDLSLVRFDSPVPGPWLSDRENVQVLLRNAGKDTIHYIYSQYAIDEIGSIVDTLNVFIPPGDSISLLLSDSADLSAFGEYSLWCNIKAEGDMYPGNDILEKSIHHYPFPDLSVEKIRIDSLPGIFCDLVMRISNNGNVRIDTMPYQIRIDEEVKYQGADSVNLDPDSFIHRTYRLIDSAGFNLVSGWYNYVFEATLPDSVNADNTISGQLLWIVYSIPLDGYNFEMKVYPNPVQNGFFISSPTRYKEDITIAIYNMQGELVQEFILFAGDDSCYVPFDANPGTYILMGEGIGSLGKLIKY